MTGRRDKVAEFLNRNGVVAVMETMAQRPQLLIMNYHRIGRCEDSEFDHGIFTTDAEGLAEQISILKKSYNLLHPQEALDLLSRKQSTSRKTSVLITFDDGYLDNLTEAVPVLKSHGAAAIFFLVTGYLDAPNTIPWWDEIAWLTRRCIGRALSLSQPTPRSFEVTGETVEYVVLQVLECARTDGVDMPRFISELRTSAGTDLRSRPGQTPRMFMNWDDARQLLREGMSLGLHTHSHRILSSLDEAGQTYELVQSKERMKAVLGIECDILAYPVGSRTAFTLTTKRIARATGYRLGFSFHGGTNTPPHVDPYDVCRVELPTYASYMRSRTALALMSATKRVWF